MNGQLRIDSVFAFVVVDDDGTEGVPAFLAGDVVMPMMGADLSMVAKLKPVAQRWAIENGKAITLTHFSTRTVQEGLRTRRLGVAGLIHLV